MRSRSGGLGLGLAISRSLAEAFGGRLTASSAGRGRGSTFRLELATAPAPAARAPERSAPVTTGSRSDPIGVSGLRILVVDDNADTLRYLSAVLKRRGHEVVTADCVASARAAVNGASAPFDLLLSDIELPDGDGMNSDARAERPRANSRHRREWLRREEDRRQSREAGFVEHLTKPVDMGSLDAAIKRAIQRARAEQPDEGQPTGGERNGAK